jgi:ring-1,2-phenylacetyl-CoA epoxidase subunit PaaE
MLKFHSLEVADIARDADDSLRIRFRVPDALTEDYRFKSGQHVALKAPIDGKDVRRTYSICAAEGEGCLEIGVRVQPGGVFSGHLAEGVKPGDTLDVMTPNGAFHLAPESEGGLYVAIAGGSGITPILSNIKTLLASDADARVVLLYLNRRTRTIMFLEEIMGLKNRYPDRLAVHHMLSQEEGDIEIAHGRLDGARARELLPRLVDPAAVDRWLLCGPGSLIDELRETLGGLGVDGDKVQFERFGLPSKHLERAAGPQAAATDATTEVTVTIDGRKRTFSMPQSGEPVVDAAARAGLDLPYSCKGGVCSTCRCRVTAGKVRMLTNYALEPWELEAGYVLGCQSVPETDTLAITYDEQ